MWFDVVILHVVHHDVDYFEFYLNLMLITLLWLCVHLFKATSFI